MQVRVCPVFLEVLALCGIVVRVVARTADGNGAMQTTRDGGVESRPGAWGGPIEVGGEGFAEGVWTARTG